MKVFHHVLKLELERLEARYMLAGDVAAEVRGSSLFVDGDDLGNRITISAVGTTVSIAGEDTTTVNGLAMQDFPGVTRHIVIRMRDGYDRVTLEDLTVDGNLIADLGDGPARLQLQDSTISGDVRMTTGRVNADDMGAAVFQELEDNVIGGRVSIRNAEATATDVDQGLYSIIHSNQIGNGLHLRQRNVVVTNFDYYPCCITAAVDTSITGNTISGGGVRVTTGDATLIQPSLYTGANDVSISNNTTIVGGVTVRLGSAETSNGDSDAVAVTGNQVWVRQNLLINGNVNIRVGNADVTADEANVIRANATRIVDNAEIRGNVAVRHGSTTAVGSAGVTEGNDVRIGQNLLIGGNVNVRVGNADVATDGADSLRGNETRILNNTDITGNVVVRQGSATAVGSAGLMVGNDVELTGNSIEGQVNLFSGDAVAVSDLGGFSFTFGTRNLIEENELNRLRITNRSGSANSQGISAGIFTDLGDNLVFGDVFLSDGNASSNGAATVATLRDSTIEGRLNYVGRNGTNALTLNSVEMVGRLVARSGNGDDSFSLTDSIFESSVRLDGGSGDADEFHDLGGNSFQPGQPALVNIEAG